MSVFYFIAEYCTWEIDTGCAINLIFRALIAGHSVSVASLMARSISMPVAGGVVGLIAWRIGWSIGWSITGRIAVSIIGQGDLSTVFDMGLACEYRSK